MYAIVKAGGRQEKVTVGETILVDHLDSKSGATVSFSAVLVVDGATVTSDPKALSSVKVTGEVIDDVKGPKIDILRYKNKTGYRRRQGFRAQHTRVKITAINIWYLSCHFYIYFSKSPFILISSVSSNSYEFPNLSNTGNFDFINFT